MPKIVKEIMNKQPKSITPEEPMHKAADMMHTHDISHLPVIDEDKQVVGHVHTNDVLKAVSEQKPHHIPVKHIMKEPAIILLEETLIPEAAEQLANAKVKGAATINERGELSGFVHARDIEEKVPNAKPHVDQILHAAKKQNPKRAA